MNTFAGLMTERLCLYALSEQAHADIALVLALLNDADFIRYIGDRQVRTPAQAAAYLREGPVAGYRRDGVGLLGLRRREDGAVLGLCGLIKRPTLADVDLGYAVLPQFRGQGYVAEAARAVLAWARVQGLRRVLAVVDPDNAASIRLLLRLQFEYREKIRLAADDIDLKLFAWQAATPGCPSAGTASMMDLSNAQ